MEQVTMKDDMALARGLNVLNGALMNEKVAEAFGMGWAMYQAA
jgi:alanine dehydrogenase